MAPRRQLARLPKHLTVKPISETTCVFDDRVSIRIDWTIRHVLGMKFITQVMHSDNFVIGDLQWSATLDARATNKHCFSPDPSVPPAMAFGLIVKYEFLDSKCRELRAQYKIKFMGPDGKVDSKAMQVFENGMTAQTSLAPEITCWGKSFYIPREVIWNNDGPSKLTLKDDTLRLRIEIKYLPETLYRCLVVNEENDFVLVSSDGDERPVHRGILEASSSYFSGLFQSNMSESRAGRFTMADVSTEVLDVFLRYMYYQCTEEMRDEEFAWAVLVAADKYQIEDLKEICEYFLVTKIMTDKVIETVVVADKYSALMVKDAALRHVVNNAKKVRASNQMAELLAENPGCSLEVVNGILEALSSILLR